jgi:hypothetical protein
MTIGASDWIVSLESVALRNLLPTFIDVNTERGCFNMQKRTLWCSASIALLAASAIAQTNTFPTSGNVGIGTTAPSYKLDVIGGDADANNYWLNGGAATSAGTVGLPNANGPGIVFYGSSASQAGSMLFYTGTSERMRINSFGNVGIGTAAPVGALSVSSADAGNLASISAWNNSWSLFGPNSGNMNGASLALGYSTTLDSSFILSLAPNVDWKPLNIRSSATYLMGGNVGIGTTTPGAALEVNGNIKLSANSGASIRFSDGTVQSTAWSGTLCGGDYAESVDITGERAQYEPGDVLVIDPGHAGRFIKASERYSTSVAGIYSTKPGLIGRRQTTDPKLASTEVPMAMVGVVPTKVSAENGPIRPGDLLVTSSSSGRAMKGTDRTMFAGAIVGKAMGSLDSGTGVIEVLVSLQ